MDVQTCAGAKFPEKGGGISAELIGVSKEESLRLS